MKFLFFHLLPIAGCIAILASCSQGKADSKVETESRTTSAPAPVEVSTASATIKTFNMELLCNGVVEASRMARICFEAQGIIETLPVTNGSMVEANQLLAQLNSSEQEMALERARNSLQRARVEMKDFLLGYSANADTATLPAQVVQTARIRSGLAEAELQVREQELRLQKTTVRAPFAGRVVDLKAKPHNPTSSYEYLCHIVDEGSLQVAFSVLESELDMASIGTQVEVFPFSNPSIKCPGEIAEVNRMVDKNGMVRVVASLSRGQASIIPGMNVRVMVRRAIPNQLVIPIDGLTRRQNRDVVFVLHDSLALWQYVTVGQRNMSEVVVVEGLKVGDRAIVSGNATIGHEAWVKDKTDDGKN